MRVEFSGKIRVAAFERCKGRCESCGLKIRLGNGPEFDHSTPDAVGGAVTLENCVVLCRTCHSVKTAKTDVPEIAKTKRIYKKAIGAERKKSRPMPGSKASGWKKKIDGTTVRR